ncbi:MAG: DUF1269 domain-containing protein [Pirellulaceae bacterium]
MAEFIVVGFDGQQKASAVLKQLQDAGDMDFNIEANAIIMRDKEGHILVDQAKDEGPAAAVGGTAIGGALGMLVGAMVAHPIAGFAIGSALGGATGAATGDVGEVGLDDDFNRQVGEMLQPDSSAICFLFWDQPWDELPGNGHQIISDGGGHILKTNLSVADENELKSVLQK